MLFTRVLSAVVTAMTVPSLLAAQTAGRLPSRAGSGVQRMCDMRYKMLTLTVVDAKGAPVSGVQVTLSGIAASSEGRPPHTTAADGRAQFAEDADMQFVAAGGADVTVTLRKGRKARRIPLRIGRDAAGCHIALLKGPSTIRF